jgi:transposase
MMGKEPPRQPQLFYTGINLEKRVRANHPLRQIERILDLSFAYKEVDVCYGYNGNVSIPPPVVLKLMLLLVFYNVRSERELMDTLPERLDWLWFLGYDIDAEAPDHSVLSKARRRWGVDVFRRLFERVVWQCVEAGLVDGTKIFVDSSLIEANASNNSVVDRTSLERYLRDGYLEFEKRLEERVEEESGGDEGRGDVNQRHVSMTDPDASVVRHGSGKARLQYKTHRAVDDAHRVITFTEVTPGDVNEAHLLMEAVDRHHENTYRSAEVVVADSMYGTKENYLACHDRGILAHIPDLKGAQDKGRRRCGIFPVEAFIYDAATDSYRCPGGQRLRLRSHHKNRQSSDYGISGKICGACELREQCTKAKCGRTVHRDARQDELDAMRDHARSRASRCDIKRRQHFMEGSFANAARYGYKRSRWRGLWRVKIQDYLVAAVQDMMILIKHGATVKMAEVIALAERRTSAIMANGVHACRRIFAKLLQVTESSLDMRRMLQNPFGQQAVKR